MKLKGKQIVITGGTSGVGNALVRKLAVENQVIVVARNAERLSELEEAYPNIDTIRSDLGKLDELRRALDDLEGKGVAVDLLINNAAIQGNGAFEEASFTLEEQEREMTVNLLAPCVLARWAAQSLMRRNGTGVVLNVGSALAFAPKRSAPIYCASKAGLRSVSRTLDYQWRERGVRVLYAMLPLVDTRMTQGRGKGKVSPVEAADFLCRQVEKERFESSMGLARLLYWIHRISPSLAYRIVKDS